MADALSHTPWGNRKTQEDFMNKFTKTLACAGLVAVLGTTSLAGCGKSLDGTKIFKMMKGHKKTNC